MKSNPFLLKIRLALIVGCILLIGVGVASYVSLSSLIDSAERRARAEETLALLERTFSTLNGVDMRLQRFILTGEASDLNEWYSLREQSRKNRLKLQELTQLPVLSSVNEIFSERRALAERAAEARTTLGLNAALGILFSEEFQSLRQRGTDLLETVRSRELAAAAEADAASRKSALRAQQLIIATGLLFLSMLAWMVSLISHYEKARDRLNAKLRESDALSRSITEGMAEGVITMDERNVILEVNQSALRLFSYGKGEMVGCHFSKLLTHSIGAGFDDLTSSLNGESESSKLADYEVQCLRRDGSEFAARMSCISAV